MIIRNFSSHSAAVIATLLIACGGNDNNGSDDLSRGPDNPGTPPQIRTGNADDGKQVFRFETFGNERFWTDAARLPAGIVEAEITPNQMLALGVQVDSDALDEGTRAQLASELQDDPSGQTSDLLNDPATTIALINANAVIGLPIKDSNNDGTLDVSDGDKVGASCALCHTVTDGSVLSQPANRPNRGSIGKRRDGLATHSLDFGSLLAIATNSRAYYPGLQLSLAANDGETLGRAPTGLTENSTEAQVDAYLKNKDFYPVGMFDDSVDGNGDPMHNMPLFRQDLAHPFGSEGGIALLDNFSNLVYTALLDPTTLTTSGGRAFLKKLGGDAAGDEIADDYEEVLADTGVTGPFPFVDASAPTDLDDVGTEAFPLGLRVDDDRLIDMNAYLQDLSAPAGASGNAQAIARGRKVFDSAGCTGCHNEDQSRFVPTFIVPMETAFPGDNPVVLLAERDPPLNPILNTVANIFDDKMAVVNASQRGLERGVALPLLLDLDRKPVFLHDNSVDSLDDLLDAARGANAPHPFFAANDGSRADLIEFLRSLGTGD